MDVRGFQSERFRGVEIAGVRRHHHHGLWLQVEELPGHQIGFLVGLVVPDKLGREDAIPGEAAELRHVRQQREVAVRERGDHVPFAETREPGYRIGPWLETMPGAVEPDLLVLCEPIDL